MTVRMYAAVAGALLVVASLSSCGTKKPKYTPTKVEVTEVVDNTIEEILVSREDVFMKKLKSTRFEGTRDLFKAISIARGPNNENGGTPLESFELGQMRLVGIIWGTTRPWVLIRTPDNVEHRASINTPVGKNAGRIISVLADQVVVLEKFYDYRGELQQEKYTLRLNPTQGAY